MMNRDEYELKLVKNERLYKKANFETLKEYLNSGTVYKKGDMLQNSRCGDIGFVEYLKYSYGSFGSGPEIVYVCEQLTKKLKKRMSYNQIWIYSGNAIFLESKRDTPKEQDNE